jgi:hypothetical protein
LLTFLGVLAVALAFVLPAERLAAQKAGKAMTKNEVIGLLESGVDPEKVTEAAQQYGIAFAVTAEVETQLRDAGGTDDLIRSLRKIAPKPASASQPPAKPAAPAAGPAVLLVEVTPGGAQVYVDDEPMGTTSQAGRLRLSQLPPGAHIVRVSLAGHQDLEQSVDLAVGQTARVTGALTFLSPSPEAVNPLAAGGSQPPAQFPQTPEPSPETVGGEPGALGVQVATQAPAGTRGAYVTAVAPGSPAERAGLRAGHSVVSVNGQPINSSEELLQTITHMRAGQAVQIGYLEGSTLRSTNARLVRRSAVAVAAEPAGPTGTSALPAPSSILPQAAMPTMPTATYTVAHDHGSGGQDYCVGTIVIAAGMVAYRATNGAHVFEFSAADIKEAKKNAVYLAALGGFHIRLKKGPNYNFVVLNPAGQYQPPDELLRIIAMSMGQN